jgi:multicomponent Na+:H+ antiporter subunit D
VPASAVHFAYKASDLGVTAAEVVVGLLLALWYVRAPEPRPVTWLRRLHNGSVNDYAAYAAGGVALCAFVLAVS